MKQKTKIKTFAAKTDDLIYHRNVTALAKMCDTSIQDIIMDALDKFYKANVISEVKQVKNA